jgi:hypothetical protein
MDISRLCRVFLDFNFGKILAMSASGKIDANRSFKKYYLICLFSLLLNSTGYYLYFIHVIKVASPGKSGILL